MEFIRANETRDAQKLISEGHLILELKRIKLMENSGAKLIITDGNDPFVLNPFK